uniref:Uncharacterized protein n=1 Tax=Panagrolaimus sp. JU765 TaxID=591449 RepID=A0AC34QI11_9BILA
MRHLLLFLIFFCAHQVEAQSNVTCDQLGYCFNNFARTLNLTTQTPWRSPREFRFEIESIYERGSQNGFLQLCQAFRALRDCLGNEYRVCMSVPTFATGGSNTVQDAYDFIGIFSQAHFTCGAGFDVFYRNEPCMSQSWSAGRRNFSRCYEEYHMRIDAGGNNAPCVAGQQLSECFEYVLTQQCSAVRTDVVWWGCEYARTFMFTQFPYCSQRCTTMKLGGIKST